MVTLKIEGMTCKHCVMAVKEAISAVPGVKGPVQVSLERGEATFEAADSVEAAIKAVQDEGYEAVSKE